MTTAEFTTTEPCSPIKVGLVDDQQLVRAGFALVINSQSDMEVVVEAGDGEAALTQLHRHQVDVVLMDVRMPKLDGLATTAALCETRENLPPGPRVIILTTFDLDEYVLAAIKAGASGFLLKDTPPEGMLEAIRTVHRGDAVISPSSTKRLISHVATALPGADRTSPQVLDSLTEREREVLVLMAKGRSNSEIASDLFVVEATVKTHVGHVLAKLQARDRVQAVVIAYETGLVTPGA
ncbi:MAG: response regulator [Beutenbergiaceae bacterium]